MAPIRTDYTEENTNILISDESERISRILEFLTYSGIDAKSRFDEESDIFQLSVPDSQYDKASALLKIYLEQEPDEETEEEPAKDIISHTFVKSEEKYKDNSSSAMSFLTVGILVIVLLVLSSLDIIPLPLTWSEQPMMFSALCVISVAFLIIGVASLQKASHYKARIAEENTYETSIIKWFLETYTGSQLDHTIEAEEGSLPQKEILCLKRFDLIRDYLLREYPSLEDGHADSLGETIYQKLYEN